MKDLYDPTETAMAGQTAIATTTFYTPDSETDRVRAKLAEKLVISALGRGYHVTVVDGGSAHEFLMALDKYGARILAQKENGMGPARREAISAAHDTGRKVIQWTEPEKISYIEQMWKASLLIVTNGAECVIPSRLNISSYPPFQAHMEMAENNYFFDLTGRELDIAFGPRAWGRELTHYFTDYKGEYGDRWDSIFVPVIRMIKDGKDVRSVIVNYVHPREQSVIETGNLAFNRKRMDQVYSLIDVFDKAWNEAEINAL